MRQFPPVPTNQAYCPGDLNQTPTVTATPGRPPTQVWKLYYFAGTDRIAMRVKSDTGADAVYYLFSDHLGSTSEVRNEDGSLHSRQWYKAFGETSYQYGSLPTQHKYTGQLEIEFGLVHFGPRAYDPLLSRWVQPDTYVPDSQGVQGWDRYAFVNNNPLRYNDPTGHCAEEDKACHGLIREIENTFGVSINDDNGLFTSSWLSALKEGMTLMRQSMGENSFNKQFSDWTIIVSDGPYKGNNMWTSGDINNKVIGIGTKIQEADYVKEWMPHELAHAWDLNCNFCKSKGMAQYTESQVKSGIYLPKGKVATDYAKTNQKEDWSESVTSVVNPSHAQNSPWDEKRQFYVNAALAPDMRWLK